MRNQAFFVVLLLCPCGLGCAGLTHIGTRNLLYEANLYKDSRLEKLYFTRLAHRAWQDVRCSCPEKNYSPDYACGFKDGYVDYLFAGGTGEPPALLPKRYLRFHEQKSRGCEGLLDWYAGFRHGAAVAHASGLRKNLLIALPPPPGPPPVGPFVPGPRPEQVKSSADVPLLPMPTKDAPRRMEQEKQIEDPPTGKEALGPSAEVLEKQP